jgi:hypothetical protein
MTDIKEFTFKDIWFDMPARISRLIWKLFSVKVAIMGTCFWLVFSDKIEGWNAVVLLLVMGLIVIFDRDAIKFIEALKGIK